MMSGNTNSIEHHFDDDLEKEIKEIASGLLYATLGWMCLILADKKYTMSEKNACEFGGEANSHLMQIIPKWTLYTKALRILNCLNCLLEATADGCANAIKKQPHCAKIENVVNITHAISEIEGFIAYLTYKRFFDNSPHNLLRAENIDFNKDNDFKRSEEDIKKIANNSLSVEDIIQAAETIGVKLDKKNIENIKEIFRQSAGRVK